MVLWRVIALNKGDGNSGQETGTIAAWVSNDGQFWVKNLEQVHFLGGTLQPRKCNKWRKLRSLRDSIVH